MSTPMQEIPLTLTPQQAATGVVIPVTLPTGPTQLHVPPCRHGDAIPVRLGDTTVLLRVTVAAGRPPQQRKGGAAGCLVPLAVIGAVLLGLYLFDDGDDTSGSRGAGSTPTFTVPTFPTLDVPTTGTTPDPTPTEEEPDPYEKGTCLNGTLPDSETAQSVSGVEEVPCSAKDAHYKVIQTFPFTSDMNRCNANPRTEYAFSHRYTMNGTTINEYVYCLIGLGSYSRG